MITSFSGDYRWLSNFYPVQVKLDDQVYPSVENAYQASKTLILSDRILFLTCTASEAKKLGKKLFLRSDWDEVKIPIMHDLCSQKFSQEYFKSKLLATGNIEIIEGNYWNDIFWGVCEGVGENHLGKIIMQIRSKIIV